MSLGTDNLNRVIGTSSYLVLILNALTITSNYLPLVILIVGVVSTNPINASFWFPVPSIPNLLSACEWIRTGPYIPNSFLNRFHDGVVEQNLFWGFCFYPRNVRQDVITLYCVVILLNASNQSTWTSLFFIGCKAHQKAIGLQNNLSQNKTLSF